MPRGGARPGAGRKPRAGSTASPPKGPQGGARPGAGRKPGRNTLYQMTREDLWAYIRAQEKRGRRANPFYVAVDLLHESQDERIIVACIEVLADRLLPKLKALEVAGQVDHTHHPSMPLQRLFAALEEEERRERETLPPWTPPALLEMGMTPQADGTRDLEDGEDDEEE